MNSRAIRLTQNALLVGLVTAALGAACGQSNDGSKNYEHDGVGEASGAGHSGAGGASASASGAGGTHSGGGGGGSSKGSAGSTTSKDKGGMGGTTAEGGNTGGAAGGGAGGGSTGGANTGGSAGKGTGGASGLGGSTVGGSGGGGKGTGHDGGASTGGTNSGGTTGTTGGGAGSTSSGGCQKGQVKAKEVIIMGESFYAISPQYIQKRIEDNAKKAGAIGASDSYRNVAISAQPMSVVAGEFDTALKGGAVKVVIMDGGGIDCMSSSCPSCPETFKTLLAKMASNGVQDVIYTRYPEPGNPPGSQTTLKNNLDALMPKMEEVCKGTTSPRCHWVDLRPVWANGDTSDGLHPTQSGGNHVGDAIWAEMVKDCIAQ